ncbi:MAG: hypothetical protein N2258_03900 [Brevinematales bacterium]|nr:hypothetical protein [Brevinematales bacterium]
MKDKNLFLILLVLIVGSCGEGKVKEEELKIIETKVISESEPYTKPKSELLDGVIYMSLAHVGDSPHEIISFHIPYDAPRIKEVGDKDRSTVWVSQSNHINETLWFRIYCLTGAGVKRNDRLPYAMDILTGWAIDEKSFKIYNRPKRLRLELYEVPYHNAVSQEDESYVLEDKIRLVYSLVVELTDEIGWHRLWINKKEEEYPTEISSGRLVIEDVYPGISNFTAISEIRFVYRETNETNKK